jgi:hypothetical protein
VSNNKKEFGTAPVFFTAISTILGAILFLQFGYAVDRSFSSKGLNNWLSKSRMKDNEPIHASDAGLVIMGFREEQINHKREEFFWGMMIWDNPFCEFP